MVLCLAQECEVIVSGGLMPLRRASWDCDGREVQKLIVLM